MTTPNLGLDKPTIGGDSSTWGTKLNGDLDSVDTKVYSQNNPVPSGSVNHNADEDHHGHSANNLQTLTFVSASTDPGGTPSNLMSTTGNGELQWRDNDGAASTLTFQGAPAGAPFYRQLVAGSVALVDLTAADNLILVDATVSARTITLPDSSHAANAGRRITVKDQLGQAATHNITVQRTGASNLIDGATSKVINSSYGVLRLVSDGTNWLTY